jgi:hypothetical protein
MLGDEERLGNVTYVYVTFLVVKKDPLNVAFYTNVSTTLNKDLPFFVGWDLNPLRSLFQAP